MCFFFNDTATTEIYTLSLHDALPICTAPFNTVLTTWKGDATGNTVYTFVNTKVYKSTNYASSWTALGTTGLPTDIFIRGIRSEEHTSELQLRQYLVCRLLLEKKKHTH